MAKGLADTTSAATLAASRVALTAGEDHADIVFRGLKTFSREIGAAIGSRRVVVKPNNVAVDIPLSATHADCIEGIFEFLKSIGKLDQAVIAESAGNGPTPEGFANYGYDKLAKKYGRGVKMVDLDKEATDDASMSGTRRTSGRMWFGCRRCCWTATRLSSRRPR